MAGNIDSQFVVDASFIVAHFLPDETNPQVDEYFSRFINGEIDFFSSPLLNFEVINCFKVAYLRKRINLRESQEFVKKFIDLQISIEEVDFEKVFEISLSKKLTVYDSSYLFLSTSRKIPLLTLDKDLQKMTI